MLPSSVRTCDCAQLITQTSQLVSEVKGLESSHAKLQRIREQLPNIQTCTSNEAAAMVATLPFVVDQRELILDLYPKLSDKVSHTLPV